MDRSQNDALVYGAKIIKSLSISFLKENIFDLNETRAFFKCSGLSKIPCRFEKWDCLKMDLDLCAGNVVIPIAVPAKQHNRGNAPAAGTLNHQPPKHCFTKSSSICSRRSTLSTLFPPIKKG
jgi:hypothetical protein